MKKNVIFLICVKSQHKYLDDKHGGFKYFEFSINSWKYWCKKNNVELFIYDTPSDSEHVNHKPTWQRWFDVFKQLDDSGIDYNKVGVIDASTIIRWDTPNFFDFVGEGEVNCFRSFENLRWLHEGVSGYSDLFDNYEFDITKYVSCGWQIFDKNHRKFLDIVKEYYYNNYDDIMELQNGKVSRGTDQPVYNYLLQIHNVNVVHKLPPPFMLNHLYRFDWFSHNWQLNKDKTPFFIKYGYIWFYSGFPARGERYNLMKQTWDAVKGMYI